MRKLSAKATERISTVFTVTLQRFGHLSLGPTCLLIFTLSLIARLSLAALAGVPDRLPFFELENIARSLADTNVFGNPYRIPTGPTAHSAPVYPFLLSLVFRFVGYGHRAVVVNVAMNLTFASIQYALLPVLAEALGIWRGVGTAAGLAGGLVPYRILTEELRDSTLAATAFVIIVTLIGRWAREPGARGAHSACLGLAIALAGMTSPPVLVVALLILSLCATRPPASPFHRNRLDICLVATFVALGLLPWMIRNYARLGELLPIRSNFGLEFDLSNNDGAQPDAESNMADQHPSWSLQEAALVAKLGEPAYNRTKLTEALRWVRSHPLHFLRLTLSRVILFWLPFYHGQQWCKNVVLHPLTLFAFYGLCRMLRRAPLPGIIFASAWLSFPLMYYVIQVDTRYRYPLDWTIWFLAAYVIVERIMAGDSLS